MINETDIIKFERTDAQLEELILFLVAVAGKNANTTAKALEKFFYTHDFEQMSPFKQIRYMDTVTGMLLQRIKNARLGCYTKLERAFRELANSKICLTTCTKDDLMEIHGIGRKSASCFLAWTRKGCRVAMLDTHLLKFLKSSQEHYSKLVFIPTMELTDNELIALKFQGITIPKSTPSSKSLYDKLEEIYLDICRAKKVDPTEFDLEIWKRYAKRS